MIKRKQVGSIEFLSDADGYVITIIRKKYDGPTTARTYRPSIYSKNRLSDWINEAVLVSDIKLGMHDLCVTYYPVPHW